jgi:hypothetical protein
VELFVGISRFPKFQKHYLHHLFGVLLAITKINGGRADDRSVRIFHHKALHNAKTYTLKQAAKLTDDAHAHTLLITRWKMEATIANNNNKATISYYIISPGDKLCNNRLQQHSIASLFH